MPKDIAGSDCLSSPSEAILCTEEEVNLLIALDTNKASGPDGISNLWKMVLMSHLCFLTYVNFDSVPHLPLLQKLKDIGLNQHILQWIASYLCNRWQYVVVDGASSTNIPVVSGAPHI